MPSFDIGEFYTSGRRNWRKYAEEKRKSKASEAATEHQRALELANIRYGEGSPAMIGARTGERIAGAEYGPGGLRGRQVGVSERGVAVEESKLGLLPWQEAMQTHRAMIGAQGKGIIHGVVPTYTKDEEGYIIKTGEEPYVLRPGAGGEYERVNIIPQKQSYDEGGYFTPPPSPGREIQTVRGEASPTQAPQYPYALPPMAMPQIPSAYTPQSSGYGTMRVEGTPGYYGVNMPEQGGTPISPAYPEIRRYGATPTPTRPKGQRRSLDEIFGR